MRKIITILVSLLAVFTFMISVNVKASTDVTMANGASIRSEGDKQGIRFTATVNGLPDGAEHGFYIALGEHSKDAFIDAIVNSKTTIGAENNKLLKRQVTNKTETFHAVIYGIPEASYTQKISAVAYAVIDGIMEFADVSITRSISEVAIKQYEADYKKDQNATTPQLVKDVYNAAQTHFDLGGGTVGEAEPIFNDQYSFVINQFDNYVTGNYGKYLMLDSTDNTFVHRFWYRIAIKYNEELGLYESVAATNDVNAVNPDTGKEAGERFSEDTIYGTDFTHTIGAYYDKTDVLPYDETVEGYCQIIKELTQLVKAGQKIYFEMEVPESKQAFTTINVRVATGMTDDSDVVSKNYQLGESLPTNLVKEGYTFGGWYDSVTGEAVTKQSISKNLTAVWNPVEYTLTYNTNEGTMPGTYDTTYNLDQMIELPTPTKQGYVFAGWYTDSSFSGEALYDLTGNVSGNLQLYAKWGQMKTTVTYELNGGQWTDEALIKENLNTLGNSVQTISIVRYTSNYYGYYTEGILICDRASMTSSANTKYAHLIGVKQVGGFYQIVQIIASGQTTAYDSSVEFFIYTGEGQSNINSVKNKANIGDYVVFSTDPKTLSAGAMTLTAVQYNTTQYNAAAKLGITETITTQTAPRAATNAGGNAVEWYDNPEFTGEPISLISVDSLDKEVTLYAKWIKGTLEVGSGKAYSTITAALNAAAAGDTIKVYEGTYSESFEITKDDITIIGPNADALSNTSRVAEANVTGTITVSASGLTINGIELSGSVNNVLFTSSQDNIRLQSINFSRPANANYVHVIYNESESLTFNNIVIDNCTFKSTTDAVLGYRPIRFNSTINNCEFTNNYFYYGSGTMTVVDIFYLKRLDGNILIANNNLAQCISTNLIMNFTNTTSDTVLTIENNIIRGVSLEKDTCPISISNATKGTQVNLIGNQFEYLTGYFFRDKLGVTTILVKYNTFVNCDTILRNENLTNITYVKNYSEDGSTITIKNSGATATVGTVTDANPFDTAEECRAEYEGRLYHVSYDVNGGDVEIENDNFVDPSKITLPTPTRFGYVFVGWYEGETKVEELSEARNYNLVAHWEELEKYSITYNTNGGTLIAPTTEYSMVEVVILPTPTRSGYNFLGWYDNEAFDGEAITKIEEGSTGDKVFYAKWYEIVTYTITYNNVSESEINDAVTTYTINDSVVLPTPSRNSFYFLGWYDNEAFNGEAITTIEKGTEGNKVFYAKWFEVVTYTITYNNVNNGELTDPVSTYTIEDEVELPTPVRDGYRFLGWEDSEGNIITVIAEGTTGNIELTATWEEITEVYVTFDFNGGSDSPVAVGGGEPIYLDEYEFKLTSFGGTNDLVSGYDNGIVTVANAQGNQMNRFWERILIKYNSELGLWQSVGVGSTTANTISQADVTYVLGTNSANNSDTTSRATILKVYNLVKNGTTVYFNIGSFTPTNVPALNASWNQTVKVATSFTEKVEATEPTTYVIDDGFGMFIAYKAGYIFDGWYDEAGNKYTSKSDFTKDVTVYARWSKDEKIIGSFETNSWVSIGDQIILNAEYENGGTEGIEWVSETPEIATVEGGVVTGVAEGLATIIAKSNGAEENYFTFYVTVVDGVPTGIVKLLTDSTNATVYTEDQLIIGTAGETGLYAPYYYDVIGGVSKYMFAPFEIHDTYLMNATNSANKSNGSFASLGTSVEFITFHYAADMPYSASAALNGGANLASYGSGSAEVSYHFGVGNDGIWSSLDEAYSGWHAGSGSRVTEWTPSGVYVEAGDPKFAKTTLESDGYFYINGRKTVQKNTTGGSILSEMGFAYKVVDGQYYMPNFWYNSTYNRVCSQGGNNNTIGFETSVRRTSDLWLTWQYSSKLSGYLLNKYNLDITRLVGHCFWSGKWCPQPLLENDLRLWHHIVAQAEQELIYFQNYSDYTLTMTPNSQYVTSTGNVTSRPTYSECVTYTVTYNNGSGDKTITLSSIIPGTQA